MITYKMLHAITPTSPVNTRMSVAEATNACCGLTMLQKGTGGKHRRVMGCGTHCRTKGFYYKEPKYGTYGTVYLCPQCAKKVGK